MISKEMVDRINELAHKAKTPEGLTPEEEAEREMLRRTYIDAFKENLRSQLENIELVDQDGNREMVKSKRVNKPDTNKLN